jgi:hypothetical protein
MGKSKYQIKAQKSVETSKTATKVGRPKYYDEEFLEKKKSKAQTQSGAPGLAIFLTVIIVTSVFGIITYVDSTKPPEEQKILSLFRRDSGGDDITELKRIEQGDTATMHYMLWIDDNRDGIIDTSQPPYQQTQEDQPFTTEVSPGRLILGFYYNLLGMEEGEEKTFELPANVDYNQDGYDDISGEPVLSYGNPEDQLFNMKLVFYIYIISIQKK